MANPLNDFGLKIFLDRYAQKDTTKATLAVDDLVVVCVNQKTRQREVGNVVELLENPGNKPRVRIKLLDGSEVTQDWDDVDKPTETTPEQTMARTARGIAGQESEEKRGEWEEKFKWLLDEWRFVPGGRILAAAGTEQALTFFNCYVLPSPKDSRTGIVETLSSMMEIMSRGGGVGINLSSLRPRHNYVKGVNGRSSGSISWGGLYSFVTGLIEQGGSRRGALMLILNLDHPDVLDFIDAKREAGKITNANISVAIPDAFMDAVRDDGDWNLVFPDTTHAAYDAEWNGDLKAWRAKGYPVVTHKTVRARELWTKIATSAWASAEPGILFIDRVNAMSNSHYFSPLICTNPCLTGDTKVALADGRGTATIKELADTGVDVAVIAVGTDGTPIPMRMRHPRVTGTAVDVYKVTIEGGHSFKATANHSMIMSSLHEVEVKDMKAGDVLWAAHRTGSVIETVRDSEQYEITVTDTNLTVESTRACEHCGRVFTPDVREVGFCSDDCHDAYFKKLDARKTYYAPGAAGVAVVAVEYVGKEDVYNGTVDELHNFCIVAADAGGTQLLLANRQCGEQPLPAWGICNLGAINLGVHVGNDGKVKWDELKQTVRYAVRFLDNVIDATPYFIDENKKQQQNERRVGLGIMGLAEMLVKCGVRYGSKAGVAFVDELGKFIATEAYTASSDYAAEKGAFPAFDADKLLDSGFMRGMPKSVRSLIKKQGLRNVTLLTVAPTGTTGTMVDTSTGVEPYFSWTYWRKSRLGMNEIEVDIVKDWRKANPDAKDLPDYFVTAMELSPEEHVVMQGALQRWIDSALSKTCNAPNNYTVEDVQNLYELMYRLGCKGGTIYRDGSRDEQVLMLKAEPVATEPVPAFDIDAEARKLGYVKPEDVLGNPDMIAKVLAAVGVQTQPEPVSRRRKDKVMQSINCKQQTHLGSCYTDVTYDRNNDPLEIFVRSGKAGSDVASLAEGLGRLASTLLTIPSPVPPMERLRDIANHLEGIGGSDSIGFGKAQIKSMPDAVGKSLAIIADELDARKGKAAPPEPAVDEAAKPKKSTRKNAGDICPSCGAATYIREEGCKHCTSCGHSACG